MTKTLQLNFSTEGGKKVMLTVDEPRTDLTAEVVAAAMTEIINTGAFIVEEYPLSLAVSARVIERTVTDLIEA